jgi:hypothetical protein
MGYLSTEQEQLVVNFFSTLNERNRRHFASLQSKILGHGSKQYLADLFSINIKTISRGIQEITSNELPEISSERSRLEGGGRKDYLQKFPNIDEAFLDVLKDNTAGDPMNDSVIWTNIKQDQIVSQLYLKHNHKVSRTVVTQLLEKHNFKKRKLQKDLPLKDVEFRDAQFLKIAALKEEYEVNNCPILSIDTKKKEMLGNFYRDGTVYCTETIYTFDHDFKSFSDGVLIPYGIYDYLKNVGYMYLGNSKDTSEFSCDNIKKWWDKYGIKNYKNSTSILILCDGGGSNSSSHYIFKEDLQRLSNEIKKEIRIAHYPPYTSKYNPIEHRLFSYISKAWSGVVFDNIQKIVSILEKTTTKKGLVIEVELVDDKIYETGRKYAEGFKESMKLIFDEKMPKWNYRVVPEI